MRYQGGEIATRIRKGVRILVDKERYFKQGRVRANCPWEAIKKAEKQFGGKVVCLMATHVENWFEFMIEL